MFSQDDLLRLDVIPNRDLMLLAKVIQALSNEKLFITMRDPSGQTLWKWRDAQEAHKYGYLLRNGPQWWKPMLTVTCVTDTNNARRTNK